MLAGVTMCHMVTRRTLDVGAIAVRLKARREALHWNQDEVAERARVSRAYVSRLERGIVPNPKTTELSQVAEALGLTLVDLIGPPPDAEVVETGFSADWDEIQRQVEDLPPEQRERVLRGFLASLEIAHGADLARRN